MSSQNISSIPSDILSTATAFSTDTVTDAGTGVVVLPTDTSLLEDVSTSFSDIEDDSNENVEITGEPVISEPVVHDTDPSIRPIISSILSDILSTATALSTDTVTNVGTGMAVQPTGTALFQDVLDIKDDNNGNVEIPDEPLISEPVEGIVKMEPLDYDSDIADQDPSHFLSNDVASTKGNEKFEPVKLPGEFACPICDKRAPKRSNINEHIKYKHGGYAARKCVCPKCDKKFVKMREATRHELACRGPGVKMPGRQVRSFATAPLKPEPVAQANCGGGIRIRECDIRLKPLQIKKRGGMVTVDLPRKQPRISILRPDLRDFMLVHDLAVTATVRAGVGPCCLSSDIRFPFSSEGEMKARNIIRASTPNSVRRDVKRLFALGDFSQLDSVTTIPDPEREVKTLMEGFLPLAAGHGLLEVFSTNKYAKDSASLGLGVGIRVKPGADTALKRGTVSQVFGDLHLIPEGVEELLQPYQKFSTLSLSNARTAPTYMMLGPIQLVNNHCRYPNAIWFKEGDRVVLKVLRAINPGLEVFIRYRSDYDCSCC